MKYITKEVRIGIAGIVALCVLIYGINWLKGIHMFQPSSYFYAKFENVNGLTKSSPVFADGVRVGIVRDIYYDYAKPGNVIVEVELDTELRIPKGSTAELVSELMGGVRMNILISLNNILGDKSIPATLHSIEKTTANLAVVSSQVKGLMSNDIPQLTSKLNTIGDNFVVISGNLKEIDYAATFKKIDETLANVKILTEKLNSKDNTLGLLFNDPTLYNNLNATTENAASLLEDLKEHPKRYVHFSLFGKKDK